MTKKFWQFTVKNVNDSNIFSIDAKHVLDTIKENGSITLKNGEGDSILIEEIDAT